MIAVDRYIHYMSAILLELVFSLSFTPAARAGEPPKLILQIAVDALRGDLPERYSNILGDGGFRYLMEQGVHYNNAHYQHANTETIVGHTSLATGTVPAAHGNSMALLMRYPAQH